MAKSKTRKVKGRSTTENFPKNDNKSKTRKVKGRKTTDRLV